MKSFLRTLFSARWFVFKFGPNTTHGALNISPSKALSEIKRRRLPASAVSATPERDHAAELRANFHLGAQRAGAFNADEMIAGKAEFLKQGLREGSVKFATKIA